MDNAKLNEVVERLFDEQPEEVRNKLFSVDLLNPIPGVQTVLMACRGGGKSTLMREMHERLMRDGQVCVRIVGEDKLTIPTFTVLASADIYDASWRMPPPSGKNAWEPAKWQGGTDHEAPLKHGKNPKAVAKRRKKKRLATKR